MKNQDTSSVFSPNRREFLHGVGGLTLVIGSSGLVSACTADRQASTAATGSTEITPNIWVTLGADDTVTVQYPATEMGQGSSTALPLILADELEAD